MCLCVFVLVCVGWCVCLCVLIKCLSQCLCSRVCVFVFCIRGDGLVCYSAPKRLKTLRSFSTRWFFKHVIVCWRI